MREFLQEDESRWDFPIGMSNFAIKHCGEEDVDFVFEDDQGIDFVVHLNPSAIKDVIEILVNRLGGINSENGEFDEAR